MPAHFRSLHAYRLIEPDEQYDLFACREGRLHLVARQLDLNGPIDRTLCGGLLPANPRWLELDTRLLRDRRLCSSCKAGLGARRKGLPSAQALW
ncbi:hypothetical protein [Stutzerimonas tarimensis]|uniref:Uncharacterized protein n=1 Tax=Stutzerimonas tarimensis TaxID=1507735 RepID=A0ABV7T691_9GAMM